MTRSRASGSGPGVALRDVETGDLGAFFRMSSDPESNELAKVHARSRNDFDAHWARILDDPSVTARSIVCDDQLVGFINAYTHDGLDLVGYWIDRPFWGRGIASGAMGVFLEEVGSRPLHALVAMDNLGSIRVLERWGFVLLETRFSEGDTRFAACEEGLYTLV